MHISQLFIYPIKSCAPVAVSSLVFDRFGPRGDRRFMLVDERGKFLSQRQLLQMANIVPEIVWDKDGQMRAINLSTETGQCQVELRSLSQRLDVTVWKDTLEALDCGDDVAEWLSEFLGRRCRLVMLPADSQRQVSLKRVEAGRYVGFADAYPLLVVNQASLDYFSEKIGRPMAVERFRPNVVVSETAAVPESDHNKAFAELGWKTLQLPQGCLKLVKLCERCVIPTRDLQTLERESDVLSVLREDCLVDGKMIFGVNAIDYDVEMICVGDEVSVS
ncbi:MOSC domain-containing protein [Bacterioplanoides sp.]|uniref:MOSC domain-containing protein n=1 Tax=Bacterioplanoides sp. TaxID=2066072 RepID=UPI003B00298B